jgi:hypothetical protein
MSPGRPDSICRHAEASATDSKTVFWSVADVTDGLSNTLFVGERATATHVSRGTFWANSFNLYSLSGAYNQSASLLADYDADPIAALTASRCARAIGMSIVIKTAIVPPAGSQPPG